MHMRRVSMVGRPTVGPLRRCRRLGLATAVATATATVALVAPPSFAAGALVRTGAARRVTTGRAIDSKYFEPGSCVEFDPTSGDRHLTVFLDAGHGGIDPGGVGETESGQTIYEEDETLPVELDTAKVLEAKGFTVVVSRTDNQLVGRSQSGDVSDGILTIQGDHDDVASRDVCANDAKANLLLGIYFDAGGSPSNAGCVTGYDTARPFAAQNLQFATLVQNDVLNAMNAQGWGIPSLGVTDDTQLGGPALSSAAANYSHLLLLGPGVPGWFDSPSEMPGALIEPLFITDPFEGSIADSASGQQVIAGGLAQAVEQYFAPPATGKKSEDSGRGNDHAAQDSQKRRPAA
jgi:N-acetylmuramoyl-L-alanine amidase